MRGINHPSIVKLLSFFESAEHYFLVLERKRSAASPTSMRSVMLTHALHQ